MLQEKFIQNEPFGKVSAPDAPLIDWLTLHGDAENQRHPKRPGLGLLIVIGTCGGFWLLAALVITSF